MKIKLPTYLFLFLFTFLVGMPITPTNAHTPDQSYLYLRVYKDAIGGRMEINVNDLNKALGLNLDDSLTEEVLAQHIEQIKSYVLSKTKFSSPNKNYNIDFTKIETLPVDDMNSDFVTLFFDLKGISEVPDQLDISYEFLNEKATNHRGMFIIEYNWKAGIVDNHTLIRHVFSPQENKVELSLAERSLWKGFVALVKLGVWHIWIGLDHILFIVALILPAVVRRREFLTDMTTVSTNVSDNYSKSWLPVLEFKPAFLYIIKIITFFTVAHSITLGLAALDVVNLPSRFVESVIALSIALAALHNIVPFLKSKEWLIAFGFGLFHGFGFASVLGEKGLSGDYMVLSLLGFNVGVELGQVLIICMIFPFLFLLRKQNLYPRLINFGSVLLILISLHWAIERWFEVNLPIGRYANLAYQAVVG